jgi:DNA-binding MarR family transcriptional regulator
MSKTIPEPIAIRDQPGHLIRRAHQIAVSTFYDTLGRDVTPIQYAVMRVLQDKPGIDQVTLAVEAALDTSTTADIAVRLEGKGWITRDLLARGQRSLSLTPNGEAILRTLVPGMQRMQQALFRSLDAREQAEFMRLLRKFVDADSQERIETPKPAGGPLLRKRRAIRVGPNHPRADR